METARRNLRADERLIFALDVGNADEAKSLVDELHGAVRFFKVGLQLFIATGLSVVHWLLEQDLNVFLDMKMEDTEETIRRSVREVAKLGVRFLTIHGNGTTAKAAKEGSKGTDLKILSLTLLTSLNEQDLRDLYLVSPKSRFNALEDYVEWRAKIAIEHGCDGLISSGQNANMLRQTLGWEPIMVCPGIRPKGDADNDHKRPTTPRLAISNGADYLVVGRPIRFASDRLSKAKEIIEEIDSALHKTVPA